MHRIELYSASAANYKAYITVYNKNNTAFTIDTFNNKYKPLYNGSVEVDGNRVYADNISLILHFV